MTHWFTSDQHFSDFTILSENLESRKRYADLSEMEEDYVEKWNSSVDINDRVYHLGDFCRGNIISATRFLRCLNGRITILLGNHDMRWSLETIKENKELRSRGGHRVNLIQGLFIYKYGAADIVLFHFPLRQWPKAHNGSWHLHGHSHGTLVPWGLTFDVGVDNTQGYLYDLDSVVAHFKEREKELKKCRS